MDYFDQQSRIAQKRNCIENKNYHLFKVKRGLRNADGSGVLVGLTTVSSVLGYQKVDEEIKPMEGHLYYRGIDIADLVKSFADDNRYGFEETVYLLLFGQLPLPDELEEFSSMLGGMRRLKKNFPGDVLLTFSTDDIMNALSRSVLTLFSRDRNADDLTLSNQVRQAMNLIAKVSTLVPYAYYAIQHQFHDKSLIIHRPDTTIGTAQNFLRLLRPNSEYTELEARTLDVALILHADHGGGNNSTFTTRVVSSTNTDFYSSISASLGSLRGPLHGGANIRVSNMMDDIKAKVKNTHSADEIRDYLFKIVNGKAFDNAGKIYGIGHAVYTKSDPRAEILREYAKRLAKEKDREEEFALYELVGKEGPKVLREYKNDPNMWVSSNVDFYSGFVYDCLDIPKEVYTPIFAIARTAGWCAHRIEMLSNPGKIMRPAFKSLFKDTTFVPLRERKPENNE